MLIIFIIAFTLVIFFFLCKLSLQLIKIEKRLSWMTEKLEKEISDVFGTYIRGGNKKEEEGTLKKE